MHLHLPLLTPDRSPNRLWWSCETRTLFHEDLSSLITVRCRQVRGAGVVIWVDALRWPMEDSPQTLPRGLERKVVRMPRQLSIQICSSIFNTFIGGTWEFNAGSRTVRHTLPFPLNPAA